MLLPDERRKRFLTILKKEEFCTIEHLARLLSVSEMTVRRDIKELSLTDPRICLCRGGVYREKEHKVIGYAASFLEREHHAEGEKRAIAKKAVSLLRDGDTVFLDASSSVKNIALFLTPESGVTVVTNSFATVGLLARRGIPVYSAGGCFNRFERAYYGELTEAMLRHFHFDAAFFTSRGIVPGDGVYDYTPDAVRLNQTVISLSDRSYHVCVACKIGVATPYRTCDLSALTAVLCEKQEDSERFGTKKNETLTGKRGHEA